MIDAGALLSASGTAICCAVELHRLASAVPPRRTGERAIVTAAALAQMPPPSPSGELQAILDRLGDAP